jgi:SAM-dependent methyltransferase
MRLVKSFTKSIHHTLGTTLEDRAYFLKKLYNEVANQSVSRERYLDVGAARTINARVFGEGFKEIYCLDINFDQQQDSKIPFITGDAQMLPLKGNTVDLLSLFSTIEHLPAPQKALSEAVRVLRPNGELVIQVPNLFFPIDLTRAYPILSGFRSLPE